MRTDTATSLEKSGVGILWCLTGLFFLRVLGQALVAYLGVGFLPPMEHGYSGLVPYRILLPIQIIILLVMVKICTDAARRRGLFAKPRTPLSRVLVGFSMLYAGAMAARYVLTMIFRPEMRWLGDAIPIFFRFVLAGFIFVLGRVFATAAEP